MVGRSEKGENQQLLIFTLFQPTHHVDYLMCDLMILQYSELQCPFSRTFIRNIVKDIERLSSYIYSNDFNLHVCI